MLDQIEGKHQLALSLAQQAMIQAAQEGIALGQWRDDVRFLLTSMNLPQPPDVLLWVSGGKASDEDVSDWESSFSVR